MLDPTQPVFDTQKRHLYLFLTPYKITHGSAADLYDIANYFSIGKPFFHYSSSNMLNSRVFFRICDRKSKCTL